MAKFQGIPRGLADLQQDGWIPDEKKIFKYSDGTQDRWADPLEVNHILQIALGGRAQQMIADYRKKGSGGPEAMAAFGPVKAAVHQAFGLEPFDSLTGRGATYEVWDGALEAYIRFFLQFGGGTDTTPTCAESTEPQQSSPAA